MSLSLDDRLSRILPRITNPEFLSGEGIGNEIACYIFDYPANAELEVRRHLENTLVKLKQNYKGLRVLHLNLLDVVVGYLEHRGLLDHALAMSGRDGDERLLKALRGPMSAEKIRDYIAGEHSLPDHDLILMSGIGSVWPMLRAHSLLNCLHTVMGRAPLVMFYPGRFDGTSLRLFDEAGTPTDVRDSKNYYRAFSLIAKDE